MNKIDELNRVLNDLNKVGNVELRVAKGIVLAAGAAIRDAQSTGPLPANIYTAYRVAQQAVFIRVNMAN